MSVAGGGPESASKASKRDEGTADRVREIAGLCDREWPNETASRMEGAGVGHGVACSNFLRSQFAAVFEPCGQPEVTGTGGLLAAQGPCLLELEQLSALIGGPHLRQLPLQLRPDANLVRTSRRRVPIPALLAPSLASAVFPLTPPNRPLLLPPDRRRAPRQRQTTRTSTSFSRESHWRGGRERRAMGETGRQTGRHADSDREVRKLDTNTLVQTQAITNRERATSQVTHKHSCIAGCDS